MSEGWLHKAAVAAVGGNGEGLTRAHWRQWEAAV